MNFRELIPAFLEQGKTEKSYTKTTVFGYKSQLSRYATWLDENELSDCPFSIEALRRYMTMRQMVDKLRPRSICMVHGALRAFGNWLVERGMMDANPVYSIKKPRMDAAQVFACSEPEAIALLDGCDRLRSLERGILAKALLSTMMFTGVRLFELLSLKLGDLNIAERRLTVQSGKGGKMRTIPVSTELKTALAAWLEIRRALQMNDALFVTGPAYAVSANSLTLIIEEVCIAAGLRGRKHLRPHSFRRYFASNMQRNGASLATISRLLGHSTINTTVRYLMTNEEEMNAAVELASPRRPEIAPKLAAVQGGRPVVMAGPRKSIRLRVA